MSSDDLNVIRTHLANERTVLAYVRTSLASIAAGAGILHFVRGDLAAFFGWTLVAAGVLIMWVGAARYIAVRKRLLKP